MAAKETNPGDDMVEFINVKGLKITAVQTTSKEDATTYPKILRELPGGLHDRLRG